MPFAVRHPNFWAEIRRRRSKGAGIRGHAALTAFMIFVCACHACAPGLIPDQSSSLLSSGRERGGREEGSTGLKDSIYFKSYVRRCREHLLSPESQGPPAQDRARDDGGGEMPLFEKCHALDSFRGVRLALD